MAQKIRVGIIFGGRSTEHEVSLQSARNVLKALNKDKYEPVLIGIDKNGAWHTAPTLINLLENATPTTQIPANLDDQVETLPVANSLHSLQANSSKLTANLDVVFPVLHGPFGEDGTVQGMLKLLNIPFVGAGVLGSAIGMDKDVMKRLLKEAKIPVAKFLVFSNQNYLLKANSYQLIANKLGSPFFVKPANTGSSVGVSKVKNDKEYQSAIKEASKYDRKIIIEQAIIGREIEVSVLGNEHPIASEPGEVIPHHEFYSYEAKYLDENGAELIIPAKLPKNVVKKLQQTAVKAFQVLNCEGLARVDFFLSKNGKIYVNEINTIPGFTNISMYPKLWEASGISQTELIDRLITLALERFSQESKILTSYSNINSS